MKIDECGVIMAHTGGFQELMNCIVDGAIKATKYISPKFTAKATRRLHKGKINKRSNTVEVLITYGTPNYEEREIIKKLKKTGEPFPRKKIQVKYPKDTRSK